MVFRCGGQKNGRMIHGVWVWVRQVWENDTWCLGMGETGMGE